MSKPHQTLIIKNFKAKVKAHLQEIGCSVVYESIDALVDDVDGEQLTRLLKESLAETERTIAAKSSLGNYITQPLPVYLKYHEFEQSVPFDTESMQQVFRSASLT
jgi:hypothetical protein